MQWLSGRVLDLRPRGRGSSLIDVTALYPGAGHIYPSLVLVQPRKTGAYITERLLMGHKNRIKQNQYSGIDEPSAELYGC